MYIIHLVHYNTNIVQVHFIFLLIEFIVVILYLRKYYHILFVIIVY